MCSLCVPVVGNKTLTCTRAGTVWVLTPSKERESDVSHTEALLKQGFKPAALREVRLLPSDFCTLYQKGCSLGETIAIGR